MPFNRTEETSGSKSPAGFEKQDVTLGTGGPGNGWRPGSRLEAAQRLFESDMQIVDPTPSKVARMPSPRRFLWVLSVVLMLLTRTRAQSPTAGEYQVKAAFLYNFAKFVEWPTHSFSNPSESLQICVFGRDPFGAELRNLTADKTVNGRKFEIDTVVDLQRARSCHILFIASSAAISVKQIVEALHGANVLTVGDSKGFAEQGGMISFVLENDRVQFAVNRTAAEQAGLKISSKLLSVAKLVIG